MISTNASVRPVIAYGNFPPESQSDGNLVRSASGPFMKKLFFAGPDPGPADISPM